MKFLHTADWHVGKTLKGRDRLDEQRAVLGRDRLDRRGEPGRRGPGGRRRLRPVGAVGARAAARGADTVADAPDRGRGHRHRGQPRPRADLRGLPAADERRRASPWWARSGRPANGGRRPLQSPLGRRGHAGRGAAVPVTAVGGARRRDRREHPVGERPRLRRAGPPGHRVADRRLRRRHGQPGDVAHHLRRRHLRRRRAVRPVDLRVQRPGQHLPRLRALRRARPPAPAAVAARARPGALQRLAARGGLRRAGQHQRRLPGRGRPPVSRPGSPTSP